MESFVTRIGDVTIERVAPKAPLSASSDVGENEQPPDLTMAKSSESEVTNTNQDSSGEFSESFTPESKGDENVESKDVGGLSDKDASKSENNAPVNNQTGADESVDSYAGQDPGPAYEGEYEDYPEDEEYPEMEEEGEVGLDPRDFLEGAPSEDEDEEGDDEIMMPLAEAVLSESSSKGNGDNEDSSQGADDAGDSAPKRSRSALSKQDKKSSGKNSVRKITVKEEPTELNGGVEGVESEMRTEDEKEADSGTEMKDEDPMSEEAGDDEEEQMAEGEEEIEGDAPEKKVRKRKMKSIKLEEGEAEVTEEQGEGESDMKKKLRTREKRKIVVEDDSDESEEEKKKKRKRRKKKGGDQTAKDEDSESSEETESEDDGSGKKKKKKKKGKKGSKKKEEDDDGSGNDKSERKATNLRRNIREVMDETQLDESTLAAQRQEMERLRRVQEQQRILREMAQQRQQQQKAESRVISLLQGNTSILKQVSVGPTSQTSPTGTKPNTVVVKLGSGANVQTNKKVLELLRVPKGTSALPSKPGTALKPSVTRTLISKPRSIQGQTMMTPSVSIAPVRPGLGPAGPRPTPMKTLPMIQPQASYSASEGEEDVDEEDEDDDILEEVEGKKKKKDVVTISSSSSSEDDCIVLSEPSDAGEEEEEEDPTNSGMHTNDSYNGPDEEGRVQVNMGKPEGDPDIFLAPHIARIIKPHQVGGIRFLYDNVIESIERFSTSTGFGCILAHSMGLGKTLQVISFCDIFLRHTPAKTVMCIMPINTLQNWLAEFNMWLPEDAAASPLAAHGEVRPRNFGLHVLNDSHKTLKARAKVIDDWSTNGGVLLIGYEMYRQLSLKKMSKPKKSRAKKKLASDDEELDPEEEEKRQKEMLDKVHEALVKPGPDLVICDEGHRIKNSHASISMALKQIRSKRRVVLTGYPLQNNLLEYWCMVDFVRPNYLGSKTEFCNMFERPIQNGQCIDSTPQDIRLMRYRAHVLHSLLEGFVQRRSHAVLQNALPQKEEYVLLVRMTAFQRKLYDTFMNEVVRTKAVPNPLKAFAVCCKIWNHPDVLYQFLKKREGGEGVDLDLEEAAAALQANTVIDPTGTVADERRTMAKSRSKGGGGSKSRKKGASNAKPAAAVMPNTSSQQGDSSAPFGMSGQYPMHNQLNQNSMLGSYNSYNASHNQSQYSGPFGSSMPHHYNPSNPYSHSGYGSNSTFNSSNSNMGMSGQAPFPGSSSSGYGDSSMASSPASQSSQFGSSSNQSMFPGTSSSSTPAASTSGYGGMGPPFFSGNSPSTQHSLSDGFGPPSTYGQNWSGSSGYNSFSQNQSGTQPSFPNQGYGSSSQSSTFQGYTAGASAPSNSSFNQGMYGPSSSSSGSGSAPPYQQGMMGQQPMMGQNMMQQPSNRSNHTMNPNMMLPQQSPVNASGMLPGGAPTKAPSMIPPSMNANMMGAGIGLGMGSSLPSMNNMAENVIGHHGMNMAPNIYQNPSMMGIPGQSQGRGPSGPMAALTNMANSDVPPSAEELLHSSTDEFSAFDPSMGNMMDNVKKTDPQSMYEIKDRSMFDPWSNSQSHPQNYQDVKPMEESLPKVKLENDSKFDMQPITLDHLKNDMRDVKLEDKPESRESKLEGDNSEDTAKDLESDRSEKSWQVGSMEMADKEKEIKDLEDKDKEVKDDEEEVVLGPDGKPVAEVVTTSKPSAKEDPGIPYDWAVELMKDYVPGLIENSAKMELFFCILEESLALGDRILVFSQSLFTLSLIEDFLQRSYIPIPGVYERWQRNRSYFRLDGSTAALEREKLINEFNANPNVYMFLVSTRAGSLGINLVGANRVIVFDASWNPCHDTQAVCRVYRYGQKKPCFVYRLVMDNCLEKKIYDRQINKQGMSDRVVDECNPDAHLSIKEVTNLCWDDEKDTEVQDFSADKDKHIDVVMQKILEKHGKTLSKAPFQHESLLVDRKDKKLSQAEKRLAKRSYEMEKRANNRPVYNYYNAGQGGLQIRAVQRDAAGNVIKPVASVRPMQSELSSQLERGGNRSTKWIPAEVWQRQGMSAQEMTLPLDVVIPTNSPERASIVLKAGQRVMVLKSPKGIYMQLENGKIIAIRTAFKMGANKGGDKPFATDKDEMRKGVLNKGNIKLSSGIHPLRNNPNITITPRNAPVGARSGIRPLMQRPLGARMQNPANMRPWVRPGGVAGRAVQLRPGQTLRPGIRSLSPSVTVTPTTAKVRTMGPVTITPRPASTTNATSTKASSGGDPKGKAEPEIDNQMEDAEKDDCKSSEDTTMSVQKNPDLEVMPVSDSKSSKNNTDSDSSWSASDRSREMITNESKEDKKWNEDHDSHSQSSDDRGKADVSEHPKSGESAAHSSSDINPLDIDEGSVSREAMGTDSVPPSAGPPSSTASDATKPSLKNFRHATSSQRRLQQEQQHQKSTVRESSGDNLLSAASDASNNSLGSQSYPPGNIYSEFNKTSPNPVGLPGSFPTSTSGAPSKPYSSGVYSNDIHSPGYSASSDHSTDEGKSQKSPAEPRGVKKETFPPPSSALDNQWKSPQAFSPGLPSGKTSSQPTSLESPAYDDNSNTSAHSNVSTKSSSNAPATEARPSNSEGPMSMYYGSDSTAPLMKSSSSSRSHSQPSNQSTSSSSKSSTTSASTSVTSTVPSVTTSSNFPPLDPYANLYGSYGTYPASLATSNYYNPYSYAPGFLPDPKSSLPSKSSTETSTSAETTSRQHSSNSKSSSSRSETKKTSHESSRSSRSDMSLPSAYESRQPAVSGSGSSRTSSASAASGSSSASAPAASDATAFPTSSSAAAAAVAAAAYNPMMMSPSFNPTSCQYPAPPTASNPANPFTAAAAAAANYATPYGSPYGYAGANQFETDLARASMYSAFHRPDPGQFPPGTALDPGSPYLPLPAHTRAMNPAAPTAGSFYSQNMYGGQYGSARDPYAQLPPYAANPFMMPAPYGGLAPSSAPSSTSSSDQPQSQ